MILKTCSECKRNIVPLLDSWMLVGGDYMHEDCLEVC